MSATILFESPAWALLAFPLLALLVFGLWQNMRQGIPSRRYLLLAGLRLAVIAILTLLVARPIWLANEPPAAASRAVIVLMDRSESMSIADRDASRYSQALEFLRERLLPGLKSANLPVLAFAFDQNAEIVDGAKLAKTTPQGKRTNLGGA